MEVVLAAPAPSACVLRSVVVCERETQASGGHGLQKVCSRSAGALILTTADIRNVGQHGPTSRLPWAGTSSLQLTRHIQIDFILENFLDDNGHLIAATDVDQRPGA